MSLNLRCFGVAILLMLAPSCQRRVKFVEPLLGSPVVVRGEVSDEEDCVVECSDPRLVNKPIHFGEARSFKLGFVELADSFDGAYAIHFAVVESDRVAFLDCTSLFVDRMVAYEVEGRIRSVFSLMTPLPYGGLISGGENGFTKSEADELIEIFKGAGE